MLHLLHAVKTITGRLRMIPFQKLRKLSKPREHKAAWGRGMHMF